MDLLKMLSANELIAQAISFLVLLVLLRAFAWKKILGLLDERKERIASEFKRIDDTKAEVARLKADLEANLASIEETRRRRIQEAIAEARILTDEIRKKAHQDSQDIINTARENIKHELANAKEELKNRVIELTMAATENLIREKLSDEADRALVREFLEKVDEVK